jgi:hypothetical protein
LHDLTVDISGERVTVLENDTDETIWIKVRARGQTFLLCNTYRSEWTDTEYCTRLNTSNVYIAYGNIFVYIIIGNVHLCIRTGDVIGKGDGISK